MSSTPARARRSTVAASPSPPAQNKKPVLTRRKHTTDAQLESSAAAAVSVSEAHFGAILVCVANVVTLSIGILIFFEIEIANTPLYDGFYIVFFKSCSLIGCLFVTYFSFSCTCDIFGSVSLGTPIFGFWRSIFVLLFCIFSCADFFAACLMHNIFDSMKDSRITHYHSLHYDYDYDWHDRIRFSTVCFFGSIPGIASAFLFPRHRLRLPLP